MLLEGCRFEYLVPVDAKAAQDTAELDATVLCVEDNRVRNGELTSLALPSLGTRIQDLVSQPFSTHADVGNPLAHGIGQPKEGWECYDQSLEERLGRLTLDQRVE